MTYNKGNLQKYQSRNPLKKLMIKYFLHRLNNVFSSICCDNLKILDAGCGEGFISEQIYNSAKNAEITAVDISEEAIEYAKKHQNPHIDFTVGDIFNLPYQDNSFDIVCAFEVLEHLQTPEKALNELNRLAKKFIILSVPNEPFFCLGNILSGKNIKRLGNPSDHINHYTLFGFKKFIEKNLHNKYDVIIVNCLVWTLAIVKKSD